MGSAPLTTLMMRPLRRAIMLPTTACVQRSAPRTLTSSVRHQSSGDDSQHGPMGPAIAALLTSRSIAPISARTRSTAIVTARASVTSSGHPSATPPALRISETVSLISASERANTATDAPAPANVCAIARPMPRPPPVTTTMCCVTTSAGLSTG